MQAYIFFSTYSHIDNSMSRFQGEKIIKNCKAHYNTRVLVFSPINIFSKSIKINSPHFLFQIEKLSCSTLEMQYMYKLDFTINN